MLKKQVVHLENDILTSFQVIGGINGSKNTYVSKLANNLSFENPFLTRKGLENATEIHVLNYVKRMKTNVPNQLLTAKQCPIV